MYKNLLELCEENELPFRARRINWAKSSYVEILSYTKLNKKSFEVYGAVPNYRKKYIDEIMPGGIIEIKNSNHRVWEVVKNG